MLTGYIVLWSLFTGLTGFANGFVSLLVARLACGLTEAGAYPTSGAVIRRWIPWSSRARASSFVSFGGRFGGTFAPYLTALLIVAFGHWRASLWVDCAVGLVIAAIYWCVVRNRPEEHPGCNEAERALIGHPPNEPSFTGRELGGALRAFCRSRSLWLNASAQMLVNIGWAYLVTWLPTYLSEQQHVEAVTGARLVSVVLAVGRVGQLAGGWLCDTTARRFGLRWGRVLPLAIAGCLGGAAYVMCLRMNSAWGVVVCCAVVSFSADLGSPASWAFMQDVGGRATAAAVGWGNKWGNFGAALSASMVPWLLARSGPGDAGQTTVFFILARKSCINQPANLGMIPMARMASWPRRGWMANHPYPCFGPDGALDRLQARKTGNGVGTQLDRLNNEIGIGIGAGLGPDEKGIFALPHAHRRHTGVPAMLAHCPHASLTSFVKTRVRSFCHTASGRFALRRSRSPGIATSSTRCAYKTASGRAEWPNRDPMKDLAGINLYAFS